MTRPALFISVAVLSGFVASERAADAEESKKTAYRVEIEWVIVDKDEKLEIRYNPALTVVDGIWGYMAVGSNMSLRDGVFKPDLRRDLRGDWGTAEVGVSCKAKVDKFDSGKVRLDMSVAANDLEKNDPAEALVQGRNFRLVKSMTPGTPEKIVLEKRAGAPCAWVTVGVSEVKPLVGPELPPLELKPMSRPEFLEMLRLHPELKDILPIPKEEPAGKKQTDKRKAEPIKD